MSDTPTPIQLEDLLPTAERSASLAVHAHREHERQELLENADSLHFVIGHIEEAAQRGARSVELPPGLVPACVVSLLRRKGYTVGDNLTRRAVAITW